MKKLLAVLLVAVLAVSFAACAQQAPATPAPAAPAADAGTEEPAPAADGAVRIGLGMPDRDAWLSLLEIAAMDRAAELGADMVAFEADNDINLQISQVQSFVTQEFDAMVIRLVAAANGDVVLEAAEHVPVVFAGRLPDEAFNQPGQVHFVGVDELEAGLLQAQFAADYFETNHPGKTDISYILIRGRLDHPGAIYRTLGFRQGMEARGFTLNNVVDQPAYWDRANAMDIVQTFLGTGIPFDIIVSNNDEMALGAIEALRAVDMMHIPVIGVDATPHGVNSILAGELAASIFQDAEALGRITTEKAVALANGEIPETHTWIPFVLVTAENAAEFPH